MRIGARITSGIWVSIPFTFMGFMMGGWIVAILLFFAIVFFLPALISDFLKEEQGKTLIKVSGLGYLLVCLYGTFFEPMTVATSVGYQYTGWYIVSIVSLCVCVAYLVVGFDLFEKTDKKQNIAPKKLVKTIKNKLQMTPREFEKFVALHYQNKGYEVKITPYSGDYGVDVIAQKGDERIAVQAKMYGNSARKVNRETVMQLYGAMTYFKCNKAVVVTDGTCMSDAIEVAHQLGVDILYIDSTGIVERQDDNISTPTDNSDVIPFDEIWVRYVMLLSGKTITNDGLTNKIVSVDWGGLKRISSKNKVSKIRIEDFKVAYNYLLANGSVERTWINQHANRCASAIFLILAQIPFIGVQNAPTKKLYLKV